MQKESRLAGVDDYNFSKKLGRGARAIIVRNACNGGMLDQYQAVNVKEQELRGKTK